MYPAVQVSNTVRENNTIVGLAPSIGWRWKSDLIGARSKFSASELIDLIRSDLI